MSEQLGNGALHERHRHRLVDGTGGVEYVNCDKFGGVRSAHVELLLSELWV
jgi:hypothetical protein